MLPLFPASSLDASILTSVLVGLLILWFFQETLGWTFTGLVVPGYFATILLVQPVSALAVTIEAVATWGIVLALSDRVPKWWPWTPMFGRDRFYAFLLASVGVRILFEAGGLAALARVTGVPVDPNVHALGLVLVPLMGHAMWRSGLAGLPRIGLPILLTWAVLRYIVLAGTNLSLTSFALTYEDLAGEFVASPQHYLLLLVGATFGSWANLSWGSDFGGLIVPGLLALCWLQPDRLAATIGEAIVIAWMLRAATALPWLRTANLTGGRPLVLAYVLGYALKFVLGWTLGGVWPGFEVRSLFGFGYLLSSLLALRIVKHGEIWRSLVPALGTSLAALIVGQGAGWLLTAALTIPTPAPPALIPPADPVPAMLLSAWTNAGGTPRLPSEGPALITGGEGFGGVWLRDGEDVLVTGRVGAVGLADAVFVVADLVHASAVQLCAADGPACEAARPALARHRVVLEVVDGDRPRVDLPAGGVAGLDVAVLGAAMGPLALGTTADHPRLVLPAARRIAVAAAAIGRAPAPWTWPTVPDGEIATSSAGDLRVLVHEVVDPWVRWWQVGEVEALALATRRAEDLGLRLLQDGPRTALVGAGWEVVLTRGASPILLDVPEGRTEPGAVRFALSLARTLDAAAIVLRANAPTSDAPVDAPTAIALALADAFGPAVQGATLRAIAQQKDPGVDLVLSRGRTLYTGEVPPTPPWLGRIEALGLSVGWFDGSAQRASCTDTGNATRQVIQALAGEDAHVTIWVRAAPAERLLPVDAVPALARSNLPMRDVPWSSLVAPVADRHAQDHIGQGDRAIACDALLGCRWLIEETCTPECGGTLLPMAPGGSTTGDPTATVAFSAAAVRWGSAP